MRYERMRKWTAIIEIRSGGRVDMIQADESHSDLLEDQTVSAVREASAFVDESEVYVVLVKTTQAGSLRDRIFSVYRDRRGRIVYSR